MQSFDHDKSSFILQLIKGESRNLQKVFSILMEEQLLCLIYYY